MAVERTLNPNEAHLTAGADFAPESALHWGKTQWAVLLVLFPLVIFAPTPVLEAVDLLVAVTLLLFKGYDDLFDRMRVTSIGSYVLFALASLYQLWDMNFLDNLCLAIITGLTLPSVMEKFRH